MSDVDNLEDCMSECARTLSALLDHHAVRQEHGEDEDVTISRQVLVDHLAAMSALAYTAGAESLRLRRDLLASGILK